MCFAVAMNHLFLSQGSDDESYVSDVSDNISEDNASVTDNISRQSRCQLHTFIYTSETKRRSSVTHTASHLLVFNNVANDA